jgi:hypothetical protein
MLIVTTILNKENAILISKETVFEIIALIYILA